MEQPGIPEQNPNTTINKMLTEDMQRVMSTANLSGKPGDYLEAGVAPTEVEQKESRINRLMGTKFGKTILKPIITQTTENVAFRAGQVQDAKKTLHSASEASDRFEAVLIRGTKKLSGVSRLERKLNERDRREGRPTSLSYREWADLQPRPEPENPDSSQENNSSPTAGENTPSDSSSENPEPVLQPETNESKTTPIPVTTEVEPAAEPEQPKPSTLSERLAAARKAAAAQSGSAQPPEADRADAQEPMKIDEASYNVIKGAIDNLAKQLIDEARKAGELTSGSEENIHEKARKTVANRVLQRKLNMKREDKRTPAFYEQRDAILDALDAYTEELEEKHRIEEEAAQAVADNADRTAIDS